MPLLGDAFIITPLTNKLSTRGVLVLVPDGTCSTDHNGALFKCVVLCTCKPLLLSCQGLHVHRQQCPCISSLYSGIAFQHVRCYA